MKCWNVPCLKVIPNDNVRQDFGVCNLGTICLQPCGPPIVQNALADLRGGAMDAPLWVPNCSAQNFQNNSIGRPNSFDFMQFSGKFGKIVCWLHPWRVGDPGGNPGSTTE